MPADSSRAVFLSYASQDAEAAHRICEALRAAGIEVWFDQNELVGGDAWDAKIRRQIAECALFVPILSANTQARREGYFRIEWRLAAQRTHAMSDDTAFLLPVVIDDTRDADARVPAEFKAVQWTRLRPIAAGQTQDDDLSRFCARVQALLGGDPMVSAPTAPSRAGVSAPALRTRRSSALRSWMLALGLAIAAGAGWYFAGRPAPSATGTTSTSAATKETGARAEARELTRKARALLDDDLMAVRESFRMAEELLQRAVTLAPDDGEAWATLARLSCEVISRNYERSAKRQEAARSQTERASRLAPESVETALARAAHLTTTLDHPAAEVVLREWLAKAPADARVALAYAQVLTRLDRRDEAMEFRQTNRALLAAPARTLAAQAGNLRVQGRYAEALENANRSLALAPSREAYFVKLLVLGINLADHDAAKALLESMPPQLRREDIFVALGARIWLRREEPERALALLRSTPQDFFEESRRVEPKGYLMGRALALAGKRVAAEEEWRGALVVLDRRLGEERNRPPYLRAKAVLLALAGNREEAERTWRLFSEFNDRDSPLDRLEANLSRLELLLAIGEHDRAVTAFLEEPGWREQPNVSAVAMLRFDPWLAELRADPRAKPIVTAAAAWQDSHRSPAAPPALASTVDPRSVVVLPFANQSSDPENEYFSDGLADELLTTLQKIPGLRVAARTSAWSFKGKGSTAREVGEKLGMAHVVEGSVLKSGPRVRITARMSRAATNEEVWSEVYGPLEVKDVFATQTELARAIVSELRGRLGAPATAEHQAEIRAQVQAAQRGGTRNLEAHEAYLQGVFWVRQYSVPAAIRGAEWLQRAVTLDDQFALAWAELSRAGWIRGGFGDAPEDSELGFRLARDAAARALALAPDLAAAHLAQADVHGSYDLDWRAAARALKRARELAPEDPTVLSSSARLACALGRIEEGLALADQAVALDPLNPERRRQRAYALLCAGRLTEAKEEFRRMVEFSPAAPWGHAGVSLVLTLEGRFDEAIREAEKEETAWTRLFARCIAEFGAKSAAADATLAEYKHAHAAGAAVQIAWVHAYRQEHDEAFAWLERAVRQRDGGLNWTKANPVLKPMHADSRWPEFLRRIGLSE